MTQKHLHSFARITTVTTIQRVREIPVGAVSKVAHGQPVEPDDVIAAAELPENHRILHAAETLGVEANEIEQYLQKHLDDLVERGDIIALKPGFLGVGSKRVIAPVDGRIVRVTNGLILLEAGRKRVEVLASVSGLMVDSDASNGRLVVESSGTLVQAAWGTGKLVTGTLVMMDHEPTTETDPNRFNVDHRGAVVGIASPVTEEFLKGAVEIKVTGLIAASMHASLIPLVKQLPFPVLLTQGFGQLPMSRRIVSLLNTYNGRAAILDPGEDTDWRNLRPEIIIPLDRTSDGSRDRDVQHELKIGGKIRILQLPHIGEIGVIKSIEDDEHCLDSGLWLPGVMAEVTDEQVIFVPFANMEYLG